MRFFFSVETVLETVLNCNQKIASKNNTELSLIGSHLSLLMVFIDPTSPQFIGTLLFQYALHPPRLSPTCHPNVVDIMPNEQPLLHRKTPHMSLACPGWTLEKKTCKA
jgi:hypothetical protein